MSDFSICSDCLGENDLIKVIKQENGEECKRCTRPFTVYRWNSGSKSQRRLNKTIICLTCARASNCCQSCMLDIVYKIPLHLRDAALKMAGISNEYEVGQMSKNREVKAIMAEKAEAKQKKKNTSDSDRAEKAKEILQTLSERLSNTAPTQQSTQKSAPVAKDFSKIVSKLPFGGSLTPPSDGSIKSFFIFGFDTNVPQYTITDYFGKFGTVASTKVVHKARCGFVTFATRQIAEQCAQSIQKEKANQKNQSIAGLVILDSRFPMRVAWGSPKPLGVSNDDYVKLATVTTKVMKQLADKAKLSNKRPEKRTSPQPAEPAKKSYKAAGDVEL